jgi:hypothetical protein
LADPATEQQRSVTGDQNLPSGSADREVKLHRRRCGASSALPRLPGRSGPSGKRG